MNCSEFKARLLQEIRSPDGEALEVHASACPGCADLREEARLLSAALDLLRGSGAGEQASPKTEARLVAALAERRRLGGAAGRFAPGARWGPVAAGIAAILGAAGALWLVSRTVEPARIVRTPGPVSAGPAAVDPLVRSAGVPGAAPMPDAATPAEAASIRQHERSSRRGRSGRRPAALETQRAALPGRTAGQPDPAPIEITRFFRTVPLGYDEPRTDLQLVRVRVPTSMLEQFGLEVDPRQAGRPVKADVLIGPDGLTRAIRFVGERTW